ncbi:MAG: peptidylprolyl isomerase [Moraxellaceae bacterium]
MRPPFFLLSFSLSVLMVFSMPVLAGTRHDLATPGVAATINGEAIPDKLVNLMQALAQRSDKQASRADVVQALIDDRLLAAHARQQYTVAELLEDNKVGFKPEVQIEQSLVSWLQAAYGPELEAAVKAEKGGSLKSVILSRKEPLPADWNAVFGAKPKMLLEYALDAKGRQAAGRIVLLSYRIDRNAPGRISLLDVYDAQNVQGRNQLHARDAGFAMAQAQQLLQWRYVMHWGQTRSSLGRDGYAVMRRAVEDRLLRDGWMSLIGVSSDIHDDNENLKKLAAAATPAEIHEYYEKHRDEFRRIEKVRARHIRLEDEKAANAAYERLQKGEAFTAVAAAVSQAPDAAQGGDLGWVIHGEKQLSWLESLTFVQKTGVPSRPFRSPARPGENPVWEILLVDEKVEGWQAEDSPEVRYVAAQDIARKKALQEYRDTTARLRAAADIRLHVGLAPMSRQDGGGL